MSQQYHRTTCLSQCQSIASPSNKQQVNGSDDQQQPGQDVDVDLRQEMAVMRSLVNNQSQIITNLQKTQSEHEEEIKNLAATYTVIADQILPDLRRSKITVNAEEQSRTNKKMSMDTAKRMYDLAISQFARSGISHYGAVANELAGMYMVEIDDIFWAKHYLEQACNLYAEWNAVVKVHQLCEEHQFIEFSETQLSSARFAIQGRSRFNVVRDSLKHSSSSMATAAAEALQATSYHERSGSMRGSRSRISGLEDTGGSGRFSINSGL